MADPAHITVRQVTHVFRDGRRLLTALSEVDLEVRQGEFVAIVGPSGGGKTTLLRIVGGVLKPTAGSVLIDGMPPSEAQRRKAIGFVFQDPALLPWRKVLDNIRLPLQLNGKHGRADQGQAEHLLELVGLAAFRDYYPHQLSGGMKQRVALARALAFGPAILLMDEPLGALDELTRAAMRYEVLRLWESSRRTAVLVTHSIPEAVLLADRIVVMSRQPGRVLAEVAVPLPRPRNEETEHSRLFLECVQQTREALGVSHGHVAAGARTGARA